MGALPAPASVADHACRAAHPAPEPAAPVRDTAPPHRRIAPGSHRNHRGHGEGGIVQEEYLAEYAADRVETTAMVWLGTTMGCARCHNHKYDPFSQK